jgi:hypothetical protein
MCGLSLRILLVTPHSIVNIIRRLCVFGEGIKKHVFPIIIAKLREVQLQIRDLLMFHHRFVNVTQL